MKYSVKRGTPLPSERKIRKIKKYLNDLIYKSKLKYAQIKNDYDIKRKLVKLFMLVINVLLTGALIKYALENRSFIAYGLISVLSMYYINWLVQTIKKPRQEKKENEEDLNEEFLEI